MKYFGMPMGMWTLFAGSFRSQLGPVFGYDAAEAKAMQKKPCRNTAASSPSCRNLKKQTVFR